MRRKIIGVPGYRNHKKDSFGVGISHLDFLDQFGNIRIIMPWERFVKVDMLYLPGGFDMRPDTYKAIPGFRTTDTDVFKQHFYDHRLRNYVENKIPIFGVCLGFQQLAVYFESTMLQNLIGHSYSAERDDLVHSVRQVYRKEDGNGYTYKKTENFEVNSLHHQGISLQGLGADLTATLLCEEEPYIVEGIKHNTLPIAGVQYHPEEIYDDFSRKSIKELLNIE